MTFCLKIVGLNNKNPGPTQPDIFYVQNKKRDCGGRDRMVVVFITTYHH